MSSDKKSSAANNAAAAARRRAKKRETAPVTPLSLARLAAVQALYQIELMGLNAGPVMDEFCAFHLGPVEEGETSDITARPEPDAPDMQGADQSHFRVIVSEATENQAALDGLIESHLSDDWTLDRMDANMRALLRAACGAWVARPDIPAKSVLKDYLDIADAFFDGQDLRFIAGVLNNLARRVEANQTDD